MIVAFCMSPHRAPATALEHRPVCCHQETETQTEFMVRGHILLVSVCGRETPSGENTGILAFTDHLRAHKPIEHTTGEGEIPDRASLRT